MRLLRLGAIGLFLFAWQTASTALPERSPFTSRIVPRSHVLHERHLPGHTKLWTRSSRADPGMLLPVRVGLKQENLEIGHQRLLDISDPSSPNYGKHLSVEEVVHLFAPKDEGARAVTEWLVSEGISAPRISRSLNKQWIQFDATVEEVEGLLYADFDLWEHLETGTVTVSSSGYHVPANIQEHIDYITPGIKLMPEDGAQGPILKRGEPDNQSLPTKRRRRVQSDTLLKGFAPTSHKASLYNVGEVADSEQSEEMEATEETGETGEAGETGETGETEQTDQVKGAEVVEIDWYKDLTVEPPYEDCLVDVTPACIRAQYNMPMGTKKHPNNKLGVFQGLNMRYWQKDLDLYFSVAAPYIPEGTHPQLNLANGAVGETDKRFESGSEAVLDFELAMSLVWPQETVLWHVDDPWYEEQHQADPLIYKGYFNNLFNAMDGSYCTFEAYNQTGNCVEPECLDPSYPNPNPGGYQGPLACGTFEPTNVLSISYSGSEASMPAPYLRRQCDEIMKLALQGVTVVVSSGDNGVGSHRSDPPPSGCLGEGQDVFNPSFLSNCPYVVSVGATQWSDVKREPEPLPEPEPEPEPVKNSGCRSRRRNGNGKERRPRKSHKNRKNRKNQKDRKGRKERRQSVEIDYFTGPYVEQSVTAFFSGGGFSNVYETPEYQIDHRDGYFAALEAANITLDVEGFEAGPDAAVDYETVGRDGKRFNARGRGYPDLSAIGDNIYVVHRGYGVLMMGTSASAPIVASMLTLINEERLAAGKSTVGWIHPVIYAHPEVFHDVTEGSNPNCQSNGFYAVEGWDPVSGLGTPDFPKLLELFMSLP